MHHKSQWAIIVAVGTNCNTVHNKCVCTGYGLWSGYDLWTLWSTLSRFKHKQAFVSISSWFLRGFCLILVVFRLLRCEWRPRQRTERLAWSVVDAENVCNGLARSKPWKTMKIQDVSGFWPISVISAISHNIWGRFFLNSLSATIGVPRKWSPKIIKKTFFKVTYSSLIHFLSDLDAFEKRSRAVFNCIFWDA